MDPVELRLINHADAAQDSDGQFINACSDALNRPTVQVLADTTVLLPRYNVAGLPETVSARLSGTVGETPFLTGLEYDAVGHRIRTAYANGIETERIYDPTTLRLSLHDLEKQFKRTGF